MLTCSPFAGWFQRTNRPMEKKKSSEVVTRSGLNRKRRRFFLHEKKEANKTQEEDYRSALVMSRLVSTAYEIQTLYGDDNA